MKQARAGFLKRILSTFTASSYPFPPGSQNRDGFERNADNPLRGWNDDLALKLSAVWACVRLLSETISTLPLNVYERLPNGERRFAPEHPLYELLHNQPNADMTAQTFWEAYCASMLLWGNAYGEKRYVGDRLVAINFLPPSRVGWTRNSDGSLKFRITQRDGTQRELPERLMFHTLGFTTDGEMGLSVVCYGSMVFRSALSAEIAASSTFDKGLMPTIAFGMDRVLTKQQRDEFRENLQSITGAVNAGKSPLLEGGMKPYEIGINPDDAQLLESRSWSVEEICRWFRVPPFMVGHSEKSTSWGTGIEQQMIGFLTFALRPWLSRIEQSTRKNLFGAQRNQFFAEFAIEGLLRADTTARSNLYASAGQNGWMTRNEMRRLENLPPVDGGDVLTVQSNLVPIDQLGQAPADTAARDALKTWLGLFDDREAA